MKGVALNVGSLGRVAPSEQQPQVVETTDAPPTVTEVAEELGLPGILEAGTSDDFFVWQALNGHDGGWLLVESPTGAVFVAGGDDALADGSVSIRVGDVVDGAEISREYVLLDQSDAGAFSNAQVTLDYVGGGVFALPEESDEDEVKLSDDVVVRTLGEESLAE